MVLRMSDRATHKLLVTELLTAASSTKQVDDYTLAGLAGCLDPSWAAFSTVYKME